MFTSIAVIAHFTDLVIAYPQYTIMDENSDDQDIFRGSAVHSYKTIQA